MGVEGVGYLLYLNMIPLPSLPTDNLYKFIFVFGVLLTLSSIYMLYDDIRLTKKEAIYEAGLVYQLQLNHKPIERTGEKVLKLQSINMSKLNKIDSLYKLIQNKKGNAQDVNEYNSLISEFKSDKTKKAKTEIEQLISKLREKMEQFKDSSEIEVNRFNTINRVNHFDDTIFLICMSISLFVGMCLTSFGGILWYIKTQQYSDRILYMQAKQLELEIKGTNKISGRPHYEPRIFRKK